MPLRGMKSISDCDICAEPTASRITFTATPARARSASASANLPPDLAVPVDVELEVDRLLRAADRGEHRREDLARRSSESSTRFPVDIGAPVSACIVCRNATSRTPNWCFMW